MLDRNTVIVLSVGILLQTVQISAYTLSTGVTYICQGAELYILPCGKVDQQAYINVRSVTVLTNSNSDLILNETLNGRGCARAEVCRRTIHSPADLGISADYLHLYNWIVSSCQGRIECNATGNLPEFWDLIDDSGLCEGTQYFASVLIDTECLVGEDLSTEPPPPPTTPRTRPTTPTTTTVTQGVTTVCAGASYELGCGRADGTKVMNITELYLLLEVEQDAFQCRTYGACQLYIGGEYDDNVTEQALLNLYKSIQHNCQGKPTCTGTLPPYSDVEIYFPMGSYSQRCGSEAPEYLSLLYIIFRCIDAGTIETLPPYEYEVPGRSTTPETTTTTLPTTTLPTNTTPTTTVSTQRCSTGDMLHDFIYRLCRLNRRLTDNVLQGCRYFTAPRCRD